MVILEPIRRFSIGNHFWASGWFISYFLLHNTLMVIIYIFIVFGILLKNRIYRFYHLLIFSHSRFTKTETTVFSFEGLKYINLEWCNECKWIMFERQYSFKTEKPNKILNLAELNAIITKKFQPTWSVASRPKSSGGLVMTYRLLEASNELDVSRNLKQLKSNIIAR